MTHLDRDTLALVALAELDLSPAEHEHLAGCPGCTGELDALRRTVLIGRSAGSVDLVTPADAVWGRIHSALGLSDAVAAPPRLAEVEVAHGDLAEAAHPGADLANGDTTGPAGEPAPVVHLDQRRRRSAWLPVAAAACAVGIIGGIVGGAWWQSTRAPAPETVIAQAQLDALPGWAASGSASVEEFADGRREVVVDLADDAGDDGLREVWLLTADATGLVSVGLLDGATGRFSIPAGIDLAEFPVVDVSAEPTDGNPAHSGDSIVRGTLAGL
ncbi:anti-sigma factor domain-containing protein [Cryobacterium sp. N22]|uniref:anti-sigma factor domain-containing protein n=1 Tax=Cryobacterium sp. N22 TaxID=2048290 RepID=UPI000CE39391|nr:anti-sigma factor [Cryobacterium sp. N22]